MTHYSIPGIPFSQLREMSDGELFQKFQDGAVLHFREAHGNFLSSLHYEGGEWVYMLQQNEQRFPNLLQFLFSINGLGLASLTSDDEDMDVTLTEK